MNLLNKINSPEDLRKLSPVELRTVADEVRQLIVDVVSEKGGHLASNLGTVELSVALHYVFSTPDDKIVWDVGHQSYPHKILTGRKDRFHTIRQKDGLSGFTARSESPYDHFGAGHASTSISAALGIAQGMKHRGLDSMAIAVIGDGSMTGGLAFEAMNNAGHIPAKNLVVVFNDNEMSIDPNVGAIAKFINHTVTHPGYNRLRHDLKNMVLSLAEHGIDLKNIVSKLRSGVKSFFTPGMLFECFGFRYFGPIDGHNVEDLLEAFSFIKKEGANEGPYLVHCLTKKGKGYARAEEDALKYHGVSAFKACDGIVPSTGPKKANYQDIFGDTMVRLANENPKVVGITAAMPSGTGLSKFQKAFPDRCYDVGIAEAHAVCFAAGLATEGVRPVAAIYSTFLQRAYDQVIHDVGIQNLPVVFAMDRAGVVGNDGATHQGAFDISYLRCVPNLVSMAPKDENELQHMLYTAILHESGPTAIRYPRGEVVGVPMDQQFQAIPIGKGELLRSSAIDPSDNDVLLIGIGYGVQTALKTDQFLQKQGFECAVINARFIKPLDERLLSQWIMQSKLIVTIEENVKAGGFGSAIMEMMQKLGLHKPVLAMGLPDRYIEHGTQSEQRKWCGVDAESISKQILKHFERDKIESKPTIPQLIEIGYTN